MTTSKLNEEHSISPATEEGNSESFKTTLFFLMNLLFTIKRLRLRYTLLNAK